MITAADVPRELLRSAFLVGKIPFKAAAADQRASYCMYIPEQQFCDTEDSSQLPLIVTVHGTSRRAETCRDSLIDLADRRGAAILAPLFPAGVDDPNDIHNYKAVRYGDIRYDLILLGIIDEVKTRWPRIGTEKVYLTGFSGGGQFCMRFLYLHPHRVEAASVGAPGSITLLDASKPWPRGISNVDSLFGGLHVDLDQIRRIKRLQLIVGDLDVNVPGGGVKDWLRKSSNTSEQHSSTHEGVANRKDALLAYHEHLKSKGIQSELQIVSEVAHSMEGALPNVINFLDQTLP